MGRAVYKKLNPSILFKSPLLRYLILPNAIFGASSLVITTSHAWVNIDYSLIGLLSPVIGRYWSAGIYLLFFIIDLIATFAPTYHLRPTIFFTIYRELSAFKLTYLIGLLALLLLPLLIAWFVAFRNGSLPSDSRSLQGRKWLIIVPLVLLFIDILNGSNRFLSVGDPICLKHNVAGSALVKIARDAVARYNKGPAKTLPLAAGEYATSRLVNELNSGRILTYNIVMVIIESWGISSDANLNQMISEPLLGHAISSRYEIHKGNIPFYGSTVPAELRELSGMRALDPDDVTRETIPARLALMGYDTVSLHGFTPNFFGRDEWYPRYGFKRSFFVDDLDKLLPSRKRCGSAMFQGICDDEIPPFMAQILSAPEAQERPKFIYWLTLNSHYPFGPPENSSAFRCDKNQLTSKYHDICNLSATIYNVLSALARLAANPDIPPTRFIISADHSPPFLMRTKEDLYDKQYVPFIELIPYESLSKTEDHHPQNR